MTFVSAWEPEPRADTKAAQERQTTVYLHLAKPGDRTLQAA
jgi:hypothetical protein